MHQLAEGTLKGQKRSAAKIITIIENDEPIKNQLFAELFPHTGKAYLIGLTGSPGAGKSSLVDCLTSVIRKEGKKVGIIAVDPSSPFSGGALLGDRIRMQEHAADPGVFIRSMGTRGSLGGLAQTTKEAVRVLDAFGCDVVIVETVGVGQSELDIMNAVDSTVVVLNPGAGDHIQTIKAGIMEIADIFAVNKADLSGADKVVSEVEGMLDFGSHADWRPPVVKCTTLTNTGITSLWEKINEHRIFLENSGLLQKKREERLKLEVIEHVEAKLRQRIRQRVLESQQMTEILGQIGQGRLTPDGAADQIISRALEPTR